MKFPKNLMDRPVDLVIGERVIKLYCPQAGRQVEPTKCVRGDAGTWMLFDGGLLACDSISLRSYAGHVRLRGHFISHKGITGRRLRKGDLQALQALGVVKADDVKAAVADIERGNKISRAQTELDCVTRDLAHFGLKPTRDQLRAIKKHIDALEAA